MAAQIAGIYTSVEKEEFEDRLPVLLPLIQKQFLGDSRPGQFVRVLETNAEEDRMKDNHYFQVLQLIMKICTHYPGFLTSDKYQENVYFFTGKLCFSRTLNLVRMIIDNSSKFQ